MPKKGAELLSLNMTSVLWGSQLANEYSVEAKGEGGWLQSPALPKSHYLLN